MLDDGCKMMTGLGYTKADNQTTDDTDAEDMPMTAAEQIEFAKAAQRVAELEAQNVVLTKSIAEQGEALTKATSAAETATAAAKLATEQAQKLADGVSTLLEKSKGNLRVVPKTSDGTTVADDLNKGAGDKPTTTQLLREAHAKPLSPFRGTRATA